MGKDEVTKEIFVLPGGPGLSASYLRFAFSELHRDFRVHYFDCPGTDTDEIDTGISVDECIQAAKITFNRLCKSEDIILVTHSWGSFVASHLLLDDTIGRRIKKVVMFNPVPLDSEAYQRVGKKLGARVRPEVAAQIPKLLEKGNLEAGQKIIELGLPAYSGTDQVPDVPLNVIQYQPRVFLSISGSIRAFSNWDALRANNTTNIIFGDKDYIDSSDFSKFDLDSANQVEVLGGHFFVLESPNEACSIVREIANK